MYKSLFTSAVSALCLAAVISCQKADFSESPREMAGHEEPAQEFSGLLPSTVSAPLSGEVTKVGMTYDPSGKVYNHHWEAGDEIRIYKAGVTGLYRTGSPEDAASGTFTLVSENSSTAYSGTDFLAVYPEDLYISRNNITVHYYDGLARVMTARSTTGSFNFTSVLGWIKIPLMGTRKVSGIYFDTSRLNVGLLNGDIDIDVDGNVTDTGNLEEPYVGYNLDEAVELSEVNATDFYMAMIPGTYNSVNGKRFMVQVMFSDGTREEVYGPAEVTVERNKVTPLKAKYIGERPTPANGALALTANCYCIKALSLPSDPDEAVYQFKAKQKGNSELLENQLTGGVRAGVLWETKLLANQSVPNGSVIKDVYYNSRDGRIQFTVMKNKIGNALIALYDRNDNILWSWHIWVTHYDMFGDDYVYGGKTYTVASMALGRLNINDFSSMDCKGLLYQWGRKDPFFPTFDPSGGNCRPFATAYPVISDAKATVAEAAAHPMTYYRGVSTTETENYVWNGGNQQNLWSDTEKTIYDPCPSGWRVISSELVADMFANTTKDSGGRVSNASSADLPVMLAGIFKFPRFPFIEPGASSRSLSNGLMYNAAAYYWTSNSDGKVADAIKGTVSTPIQYLDQDTQKTAYACPVRCMKIK